MEIVTQWIQPIMVLLVLGFTVYQTIVLRTQVTKQKDIIAGMQAYQNIIKLDEVEKYVGMRERTITALTKEEKEKAEGDLKKLIEVQMDELSKAQQEQRTNLSALATTEQQVAELTARLNEAEKAIEVYDEDIESYVNITLDLMNAAVVLTATYVPKNNWMDFAEKELTGASRKVFMEGLIAKGEKIYDETQGKQLKMIQERMKILATTPSFDALKRIQFYSDLVHKGKAKSSDRPSELLKHQGDIDKYFPDESPQRD